MTLPTTNISTSLVRDEIGEGFTAVGGLNLSENVNPWGFNLPISVDQNRIWGKLPRTAPYELGAFRGYNHLWRCYSMGDPTIPAVFAYYDAGNIMVNLKYFPNASAVTSGVNHYFDVFFSRTNDFTHASHVQLMNDVAIADNGQLELPLNPFSPPDGGAALSANSSVYYKIKHVSSPDRRWDERMFQPSATILDDVNDTESYIIKVDIGQDIFNYYADFFRTMGTEPMAWQYAGSGGMVAYVTLRNGSRSPVTLNMEFEINNSAAFNGNSDYIANGSFVVPAASIVNGAMVYGTVDVAIELINALSKFTIGQAYYGRVRITSVTSGTYNMNYSTGFDGTILNSPPVD